MARDRYLQALRGAAIAAVVLIHCLPVCAASVVARPFLNWSVAVFLFLSGYLTDELEIKRGGVLSRRLRKTLPPYVVWSAVYSLAFQRDGLLGFLGSLLTGGAAAHMYFLFLYAQLTILTPLIYRALESSRILVYSVTPVALIAYELATAAGFVFPVLGRLFPFWMLFYVVGLDWKRWRRVVEDKRGIWTWVLAGCVCLQIVAGYCWNSFGDYNMATTQIKLSSMATSLAVIAVMMSVSLRARSAVSSSPLVPLGDASFGIYLSHMLVLAVVHKVLALIAIPGMLSVVLAWLLTLGLSYAFCIVANKALPAKASRILGL